MFRRMFSRQWWWTTLLVIAACGVMVRLGIWQLDRLEQRRAFNARVQAQINRESIVLDADTLDEDLVSMEYRSAVVVGEYDHDQEVGLRNQVWGNQPGIHLVTPLRISGSDRAVLVDRGWIPAEDSSRERWSQYAQPGMVQIQGVIRRSTTRPQIGRRTDPTPLPGQGRLDLWNLLNVERIDDQVPGSLLPVYIQQVPDPDQSAPPYPSPLELDLSEGPHLGYAGQWFLFALVLAVGYPLYLRRQPVDHTPGATQLQQSES